MQEECMHIDADCHVSSRPDAGVSIDELLKMMDQVGVDRAITWPMVSYTREIASDNATIHEGYVAHPDRIIPFGGVNPRLGLQEAQDLLKRCIEEYGVKGVKLNGARDIYYIDDPELSLPLVDMIAEAGLVLAFHVGSNDFERTHPYRVAKVSDRHPDLKILLVHMGGSDKPTIHDAVLDFVARYPNWYLIDSEADYRKAQQAIRELGADRVMYGSDTPFMPMRYEWGMRQVAYQDLSEDERAKVLGGNVARLFGLD
jgi:uncharacterized protein